MSSLQNISLKLSKKINKHILPSKIKLHAKIVLSDIGKSKLIQYYTDTMKTKQIKK